jgi:Histidine kinase-, DNA gyrase B-, and HSP90-like ATPase
MAVAKINITPDVSLLPKSGEVNYRIADAIAELVDNSIDERIPGKKLQIEIKVSQRGGEKHIDVTDDAGGMALEQAHEAMILARSTKKPGKIGEFGLGMKTACSNLGAHFEIVTATKDAKKAVKITYDEAEFLKRGKWEIDSEEIDKPFSHGTKITISKLKVSAYPGVKDTILKNFGSIFKYFVASGEVEIVVNDDPVQPNYRETIDECDTKIDFEVNGKRVHGFATLLKTGAPTSGYGMTLIRHHRVISENEKIGFTAQAGLTRLYGELHLDDWPVNNNKTDFRRDTPDWIEMVKVLDEQLVELKRESRRMAHPGKLKGKDKAEVETFTEDVKKVLKSDDLHQDLDRRALDAALADEMSAGSLPFVLPTTDADGEPVAGNGASSGAGGGGAREPRTIEEHRLHRVKTQLRSLDIEAQVATLGQDSLYKIWQVQGVGNKKKLVVTTNADHPFYQAIQSDFVLWVKLNIVESVAEFFTQSAGQTSAMLLVKSDIMKRISQIKLAVEEAETVEA